MNKYLIASSGDNLDSKISGRFGHADNFIVVDPETMRYEVFPGVPKDQRTIGVANFIKYDISKVLVGNIGPSTFNEAKANGLEVYLCRRMTVSEAIEKVKKGELSPLQEPTLNSSIHSPQKSEGEERGRGEGMGKGTGRGMGKKGKGVGRRGKGYRRDKGNGIKDR
ncbi:MAG: NifB/NifX family molybdenum-iron cluster-binding protein [Bacteroidales bacterium]